MRPFILSLLKVGQDAVDDMRLGGEEVDGIDIAIVRSSVEDLLDVWSKSGGLCERAVKRRRRILVTFSFKMASWSRTLSMSLRDSGSTTKTFHWRRGSAHEEEEVEEAFEGGNTRRRG
jgi:hypothetical protein